MSKARFKAKHINFRNVTTESLKLDNDFMTYEEFKLHYFKASDKILFQEEVMQIGLKEKDIHKATHPFIRERLRELGADSNISMGSGDLYDQWSNFTGNPKKLTKQQFDILKDQDLIDELKFSTWSYVTGNPQSLTEDQFEALRKQDAISFPVKEKATNTEIW